MRGGGGGRGGGGARRALAAWQALLARQLHGAPQVPGSKAAIRLPALAELGQRARQRHAAQAVGEAKAVADAEVVDRQHIGALQLKDQHHLDGPATDAAHAGEPLDDLQVAERSELRGVRHDALERLGRQILQRRDFGEREAHGTQRRGPGREQLRGRGERCRCMQRDETGEDALGRRAVQLLMGDGAHQGFERALQRAQRAAGEPRGSHGLDQARHDRIGFQDAMGGAAHERLGWQCGQ